MITAQNMDRMARDLERRLGALCSVARNTRCGAMRVNQSRAVEDALEFFAGAWAAAQAECMDELAKLRAGAAIKSADAELLLALYHEAAERHAIVDALGRRWLEHGLLETNDGIEMRAVLERLQNVYSFLLAAEESGLYPHLEATRGLIPLHIANQETA